MLQEIAKLKEYNFPLNNAYASAYCPEFVVFRAKFKTNKR